MAKKRKCSFCEVNIRGHLSHCKVQGCPILKEQSGSSGGAITGQHWEFEDLTKKLYSRMQTMDNVPETKYSYVWPSGADWEGALAHDIRNMMC